MVLLSSFAFAGEYPACNILESKKVSFRSPDSKDILEISVIGNPCYEAKLNLKLKSEQGVPLYEYNSQFKQHNSIHWDEPDMDEVAMKHVQYILDNAITSSSELPDIFLCEVQEPSCEPYEKNTVPLEKYKAIKASNVPMLNHSTYYEGWASFVYDPSTKKRDIIKTGV